MTNYLESTVPGEPNDELLKYTTAFNPDNAAELEAKWPGKSMFLADAASGWLDSRIGKRYVRPVPNPPPIIKKLTAWLIESELFMAVGIRPTDEQQTTIEEHFKFAHQELKEIADAKDGKYDLPLSADDPSSGIKEPATRACSEQSPYSWRHKQFDAVSGDRRYG